ncbi:MAG: hypothetical protein J6Y71_10290 [Ruminococcus sp.]|nr:hypothetical protein [Ruminococcus sp.]
MIKKCKICGIDVKAIANTMYCKTCAEKLRRQKAKLRKGYQIKGQSSSLSEDIHQAIMAGVSYGSYKGR